MPVLAATVLMTGISRWGGSDKHRPEEGPVLDARIDQGHIFMEVRLRGRRRLIDLVFDADGIWRGTWSFLRSKEVGGTCDLHQKTGGPKTMTLRGTWQDAHHESCTWHLTLQEKTSG